MTDSNHAYVTSLECAWCGGSAIARPDGWFGEDEGERCDTCLLPGHVAIDYDDVDGTPIAWWSADDREETVEKWATEHSNHPEVRLYRKEPFMVPNEV